MRVIVLPLLLSVCLGLAGCAMLGPSTDDAGKRTFGTRMNDNRTESLAIKNIHKAHADLAEAHVMVNSYNGIVLLTGQVPSEEARIAAGQVVEELRHVRQVHNELEVAGPTSLVSRTNDFWLSTKIRTQMGFSPDADAGRIKVITENGVVFLMGLLTREEAERAVALTRDVFGVQKIVTVFEYIN